MSDQEKNPDAVALGRRGGLAKSRKKAAAGRANLEKAREVQKVRREQSQPGHAIAEALRNDPALVAELRDALRKALFG